jgi:tetratricopeptide (TPR) repeat protein
LMITLREQGMLEEAETVFRELLAKAGQTWVNYPGAWELSSDILARRGKYRDAEQFLTNTPNLIVVDKYGNARPACGDFHARIGRWNAAVSDFSKAVELEPQNVENYHRLVPLLMQSGRLDDYHE